jgi:23S rRNA pseudouridine2457 synthase
MTNPILLFKPFEVLCQFTDAAGRTTLKEFIPIPDIYPVGRLDYRSEGLLLLSDDGRLNQRLADPRFEHPKTYWAEVEGLVSEAAIARLQQAILLPGLQTRLAGARQISAPDLPARSKPVRAYHPTSWIEIVLREGKKHQVRRMTAAVGFPTLRLVRYAIGELTLQGLNPGEWRPLTAVELRYLRQSTGIR